MTGGLARMRRRRTRERGGAKGPALSLPDALAGGSVQVPQTERLANRRVVGLPRTLLGDAYHRMLTARWRVFLPMAALTYLAINLVFALLYMLDPHGISEMRPGSLADAYFFSVQTLATIGYGRMAPVDVWPNVVMTAETLTGLAGLALATGLGFTRFARPTARVAFSRRAVVTPFEGVPTLMVRLGNQRSSQIVEADVSLTLLRNETTREGIVMRRFHALTLARAHSPVFALSFTAMHPITPDSPLAGATTESLAAQGAEVLVTVTGLEEALLQTVHARHSYLPGEIAFGGTFADMLSSDPDGRLVIDFGLFDRLRGE